MKEQLGMHETLELHELMSFKTVCAAKASAMKEMASDSQLKSLLEQDINMARQAIQELQGMLSGNTNMLQ